MARVPATPEPALTTPIGTPGQPWSPEERLAWRRSQTPKRSYQDEVLDKIDALRGRFAVEQYGALTYPDHPGSVTQVGRFVLLGLRSPNSSPDRPTALITGGVHGYETSGVQGALRFAEVAAEAFAGRVDLAIAPCVSPWAYQVIHRWNPDAIDPNRSFVEDSPAAECRALMRWVAGLGDLLVHIDLHETTDSDNTEFRPAKAARDGLVETHGEIPDGFYLVGRTDRPVPGFQAAIRDRVAQVTHIAEPDSDGRLIGVPLQQRGVIEYDAVSLGLCMGFTDATYATTTEVYPDSALVDGEICIQAQVAAITAALDFALR